MRLFKRFVFWIIAILVGYILVGIVNTLTSQTGYVYIHPENDTSRCLQISYIESGFPIRDVHIQSSGNRTVECGNTLRAELGNTSMGLVPFILNWVFYSLVTYLGLRYMKRKYANNWY